MSDASAPTSPLPGRPATWLTFGLVAVATAAVEIVVADRQAWPAWAWVKAAGFVLFALLGRRWLGSRPRQGRIPLRVVLAVVGCAVLGAGVECWGLETNRGSEPMEICLLCGCRDLLLGLAVLSAWPVCQRLIGLGAYG